MLCTWTTSAPRSRTAATSSSSSRPPRSNAPGRGHPAHRVRAPFEQRVLDPGAAQRLAAGARRSAPLRPRRGSGCARPGRAGSSWGPANLAARWPPPPSLSIVPTVGRAGYLETTLASVTAQELDRSFEVLVVDDASTDATGEVCERFGVRYVRQPRRSGPNAGRNAGIAASTGELVVFVDDDIEAPDRWLRGARRRGRAPPRRRGVRRPDQGPAGGSALRRDAAARTHRSRRSTWARTTGSARRCGRRT